MEDNIAVEVHPKHNEDEHHIDDILKELEQKLREDHEFLNKKINDIIETNLDPKLISDLFDLASIGQKFVDFVIQKKDRSTIMNDNMGDIWDGMTLKDLINNQVDKEYYIRTLQTVQSKIGILGKRAARDAINQPGQGGRWVEEQKHDEIILA